VRSDSLKWVLLASAMLVLASAIRYATRHHLPIGYDETMYVNQVLFDRDVLVEQGPLVFARKQVGTETWRPPGYRLAAAPVSLLAGGSAVALRSLSLVSLGLMTILLFAAGRELAGTAAGITWAGAASLAPGILVTDLQFGTEVTLYPAIALALLGVARLLHRGVADRSTCLILFFGAAIGGLSKLSFFMVFLPLIAMAWWLARGQRWRVALSAGGGLLLIAPWWFFNWRDALHYARYASDFVRHEYPYLTALTVDLLGVPFAAGIALAGIWLVVRARRGGVEAAGPIRAMVVCCLAASIPLLLLHVMGRNHNMRLLSPALLPAGGILALLLYANGAFSRPLVRAAAAVVVAAQALLLARETWIVAEAQRDWGPIRAMVRGQPPEEIRVAHLGNAGGLNAPQLLHAWRRHGETIDLDWLWRWESGPIRWDRVLPRVDSADVVVIPMVSLADRDPGGNDNQYNTTLISTLAARPDAWAADTLPRTATDSVSYLVFTRRPH
jgi:hypothetical protein